jgi:hypothetical protein
MFHARSVTNAEICDTLCHWFCIPQILCVQRDNTMISYQLNIFGLEIRTFDSTTTTRTSRVCIYRRCRRLLLSTLHLKKGFQEAEASKFYTAGT